MGSTCPRPAHFRDVTLGPKCDSCAKTGGVPGVESADSCLMSRQGCGAHYQFGWLQGVFGTYCGGMVSGCRGPIRTEYNNY